MFNSISTNPGRTANLTVTRKPAPQLDKTRAGSAVVDGNISPPRHHRG